jgi:hypothetical protein
MFGMNRQRGGSQAQRGENPVTANVEIPEDVLTALKGIVAWSEYSGDGNDSVDEVLADHIPAVAEWLRELGLIEARDE